ncbi:MAG: TolC family protein, partial [Balneolales bacterium]
MKYKIIILTAVLIPVFTAAQTSPQTITLDDAYEQVYENYPTAGKAEIREKITELNTRIVQSGWYPDVQISARSSYQSDVTAIPFEAAGMKVPALSRDYYNISLDVSQPLFDGGRVASSRELEEHTGRREQAAIETELREVRNQVDQVYFGILMMKKQKESLDLMLDDLQEQLDMVHVQVINGVLLPGNELVLKAERIKAEQQLTQIEADLRAGYQVLSAILGMPVPQETTLETPDISKAPVRISQETNRAEYDVFEASRLGLDAQRDLTRADRLPTISAFATTAYGRPGFNVFEDDFQFNWVVGLMARWSFRSWSNAPRQMEVLELEKRNLDADQEAFTRRLNAELRQ